MFALFPFSNLSRLLQCEEGWWFPDAALMSGWGGLWSMYVSRTERGVRREGGALYGTTGPGWNMRAGDPRSPFPVSTLSASCLVISALLKHPMKALPQINVCASLFFTGLKWLTLSARPSPSFPFLFFCSIPVSALRCHKRSYSLWFTLRFLRDGLGTPERTMLLLVLLKEWIFTRHQRKGMRDCELLTILHLSLLCKK